MNIEFDAVSGDSIDRLVALQRVRALIDSIEAELLVETASTAPVVHEYTVLGESEEERTIRSRTAGGGRLRPAVDGGVDSGPHRRGPVAVRTAHGDHGRAAGR